MKINLADKMLAITFALPIKKGSLVQRKKWDKKENNLKDYTAKGEGRKTLTE
jgi:hypothetical protein